MANVHFLKVNVNSAIQDVIGEKVNIENYLEKLYQTIDDIAEYKLETNKFVDEGGKEIAKYDTYVFSEILKEDNMVIEGKLVRRFNKTTEQYDPKKKKSREFKIPENSASIIFYFDVKNEIIAFIKRQSFGIKQFRSGFEGLINKLDIGTDFNLQFMQDPFSIREHINDADKILQLKTINVMPNALSRELEKFMGLSEKLMEDANANKLTMDYEASPHNHGINKDSDVVKSIINGDPIDNKAYRGYEKVEFTAVDKDGYSYHYNSEKDSLLIADIDDTMSKSSEALKEISEKTIHRIIIREIQENYKKEEK